MKLGGCTKKLILNAYSPTFGLNVVSTFRCAVFSWVGFFFNETAMLLPVKLQVHGPLWRRSPLALLLVIVALHMLAIPPKTMALDQAILSNFLFQFLALRSYVTVFLWNLYEIKPVNSFFKKKVTLPTLPFSCKISQIFTLSLFLFCLNTSWFEFQQTKSTKFVLRILWT
jgi:hypothetical protein